MVSKKEGGVSYFFRTNVYPLTLIILAPPAVQLFWVVCIHYNGSMLDALNVLRTSPQTIWSQFPSATVSAATLSAKFLLMQLLLLVGLPHSKFTAILTPMGNRPQYRINGTTSFLLTHAVLYGLHYSGLWDYTVVYDQFGSILSVLNSFALVATVLLYIRGIVSPTNSDSGTTGHGIIWDLWQGTELHPEIFSVSLKQLINCRFAMMGWSVLIVAFAIKQAESNPNANDVWATSTAVSVALQLAYILKFFHWEAGYFNSVDIIHDRFGFYIFWGCTAYLPSLYTLATFYLASNPVVISNTYAAALTCMGLGALWANYDADRQRQAFRACNGRDAIWGKKPTIIHATYTTGDGVQRNSILLASGWWGVSRHVNYVFEIILAFCWSAPAATSKIIPYFYTIFLVILLTDRAYRDEIRCEEKYGEGYRRYCEQVRYRMIPGVY